MGCAKDRGIFCFHGIGQKVRFFHKLQKSSFRFTKRYSTVRVCLCRIASKKRKKWKKSFFQGWKCWPKYMWCMGVFLTSFLWLSWYRGSWVERVSKRSKGCVSSGGLVLRMPEQSLAYRYFAILLCCLLRVSLQLGYMDPYLWILLILSYCTSSIENFSQLSIILLRVCIALYQIMPICFCTEIVYYIDSSFHCWIVCIFIVDFIAYYVRRYEYLVNCIVLSHWSRKTNNVVYTNLHHKIILKHKSNKLFYKPSLWEHMRIMVEPIPIADISNGNWR